MSQKPKQKTGGIAGPRRIPKLVADWVESPPVQAAPPAPKPAPAAPARPASRFASLNAPRARRDEAPVEEAPKRAAPVADDDIPEESWSAPKASAPREPADTSNPLVAAVLAQFRGSTCSGMSPLVENAQEPIVAPKVELPTEVQEKTRDFLNEAFKTHGPAMHAKGWCVVPQDFDGERRPARNERAKYYVKPSLFYAAQPGDAEMERMLKFFGEKNAAIVSGQCSGWSMVVDIDVKDADLSAKIAAAATEILGDTPLQRVGQAPKLAMIYRCPPVLGEDNKVVWQLSKIAKTFGLETPEMDEKGEEKSSGDAVEILCSGGLLTAAGIHHRTRGEFVWLDKAPWEVGPEAAPIVTREQIEKFLERCNEIRAFTRKRGGSQGGVDPALVSEFVKHKNGINRPLMARWHREEDGEKIFDDREKWMRDYSLAICAGNGACCMDEQGIQKLVAFAHWELRQRVEEGRGRSMERMQGEIAVKIRADAKKVRAAVAALLKGDDLDKKMHIRPWRLHDMGNNRLSKPAAHIIPRVRPATGELNWLGAGDMLGGQTAWERNKSAVRPLGAPVEVEGAREERALITDREPIAKRIAKSIDKGLSAVLADVLAKKNAVHVLPHATGSGKSTRVLKALLRFAQENPRFETIDGVLVDHGPIIFLAPTHQNLFELTKVALAAEGVVVDFPSMDDFAAFARANGVKAMVYKGATRPNMCKRADERKVLNEAGFAADRLCQSKTKKKLLGGEVEVVEKECVHYHECPVIQQRLDAEVAQIVFMPNSYMTASYLPSTLKKVRMVASDEAITFKILNTAFLPLTSLRLDRKVPRLTKEEEAAGLTAEELMDRRLRAVEVVEAAQAEKRCPAIMLSQHPDGMKWVEAAKAITGRAQAMMLEVEAGMSMGAIEDLTRFAQATDLLLEWRFWSVILERMEWLALDAASVDGIRRARGDREYRLQPIVINATTEHVDDDFVKTQVTGPTPGWRVSWRSQMNWSEATWLLLDASANFHITQRLFHGTPVHWHDCPAPLNLRVVGICDRVYSTSSFIPKEDAPEKIKARAADQTRKTKELISLMAAAHGFGKMLVTATTKVRKHLFEGFAWPVNLDHGHLGAMRGIDAYKHHVCHLAIGRTEMPIWVVDGYTAALTYDLAGEKGESGEPTPWSDPEEPYDTRGDGLIMGDDGKEVALMRQVPVGGRRTMMRSGHDVRLPVPELKDRFWGQLVDEQWRDEETRQAIGRLRPVYRSETPTVVIMSSCIPTGIVVDEMISLDDLLAGARGKVWDAIRRSEGVVDPQLTPAMAAPEDRELVRDACVEMIARPAYKLPGFTPLEWKTWEGESGKSLIASWHKDPEQGFMGAWCRAMYHRDLLESVVVGAPRRVVEDGGQREDDWLMVEIGGRDMATKVEEDLLYAARNSIVEPKGDDEVPFTGTGE